MLQTMQQPATTQPSPTFAVMLAALAAPVPKRSGAWTDEDFVDDTATLSYERALRADTRNSSLDLNDGALEQSAEAEHSRVDPDELPAVAEDLGAPMETLQARCSSFADVKPGVAGSSFTVHDRNLKCASITMRLSSAESVQLRQRAVEAGVTVSAYLRSCTVEAESLRAQVKDALARLRSEASKDVQTASPSAGSSWLGRLRWFWPNPHDRDRTVRA